MGLDNITLQAAAPNNFKKVVYAGLSFTALFSGYIAAQNAASTVYENIGYTKLGETCVLFIYLFLGLGSIVASYIKQKLTHRAGFLIGAVSYGAIVLAGLITSTCEGNKEAAYCSDTAVRILNIIFSMVVGFGGSIIWLTQSDYIDTASSEQTKGSYNGTFWTLMQLSQIISSIMVIVMLPIGTTKLYCVLLGFVIVAIAMFSFTPVLPPNPEKTIAAYESLSGSVQKFGRAFTTKRSFFLLPGMLLIGIAIAFYANFLTQVNKSMPLPAELITIPLNLEAIKDHYNSRFSFILISIAFGEVAAGLTVGRFADKFNKVKVYHAILLVPEVALLLTFIAYQASCYPILLLSAFLWGYTDTALNSILGITIGSFFGGKMEYFCLMRFLLGFGAMAGSLLALVVTDIVTFSIITAVCIAILHVAYIFTKDDNISAKQDYEEPLTAATYSDF